MNFNFSISLSDSPTRYAFLLETNKCVSHYNVLLFFSFLFLWKGYECLITWSVKTAEVESLKIQILKIKMDYIVYHNFKNKN